MLKSEVLTAVSLLSQVELDHDFDEALKKTIHSLGEKINIEPLHSMKHVRQTYRTSFETTISIGQFICLSLECLSCLKEALARDSDETQRLLSVTQQKCIRTVLDHVVQLGISANLLPGVEQLSNNVCPVQPSLSEMEKYECLCLVTLSLVDLYHDDTLHGILLPKFLPPVMCALCQLTMVPLKKSTDIFTRLQQERLIFQQHLDELVTKLYQPMVIKELMVIQGNKNSPKWLKRGVGRLLTAQLHRPNGVMAIVQAVRDAANTTAPTTLAHLESLAQVVTSSPNLDIICPQILSLLDYNDAELVRVAVLCLKSLQHKDEAMCATHLLQPMTRPLAGDLASEQSISLCLQRLHKCFAVPASDFWCLPSHLLQTHIHTLFRLYCKVYQSASHIRQIVEDLVWCFLSKCYENMLPSIFHCLIYNERTPGVEIIRGVQFVFGDDGGVKIVTVEESEHSLEEFGDGLMILLERRDTKGHLGNKLFVTLLESVVTKKELQTVDHFEQQLVTVKLLAVLSENITVQKSLSENPGPVVKFLKEMIEGFLSNLIHDVEIISIVLVVLNVILNDCIFSKKCSWPIFSQLEDPLFQLKNKTGNTELKLLAEEAYNAILTHGAVKPKQNTGLLHKEDKVITRNISTCEKALKEACDPLLPVRGHAIMQLGKLLASRDVQAKAKKDQILCIFQENLKHEDSFLYLSAIEGLAVAAAEFPDTVIVALVEEYSRHTLSPDSRLKVGEALIRVTRLLGELAPVYKTELINAFLSGTRDEDFLVRASSLSNLGELCRVLGFRIGTIVTEVLLCAECISRDPSVEVRRAAVMLIYLLLKGLQKDALSVLQDVLLQLYKTLKNIYSLDKDDVTRLHAQLALEELNAGTLSFLFPKPLLTKKIFVLDPPT